LRYESILFNAGVNGVYFHGLEVWVDQPLPPQWKRPVKQMLVLTSIAGSNGYAAEHTSFGSDASVEIELVIDAVTGIVSEVRTEVVTVLEADAFAAIHIFAEIEPHCR
jgi:hypothetical protein